MFFDQFSTFDTVMVSAFTITNLQGTYTYPQAGANGIVRQFEVFQGKLYAVGDFTQIGGELAWGLAEFDGTRWWGLGEKLLMDQVYQIIEYQDKLVISGSSREVGQDGLIRYMSWDGKALQTLGFAETGGQMEEYRGLLYLNFGHRLGVWNGNGLVFIDAPGVDTITYFKAVNDLLYLRGFSGQHCVNSSEDVWVYDCEATGFLLQFDGSTWSALNYSGFADCLNTGAITWSYHVWINSEPEFNWSVLTGYQNKVFFNCGFADQGVFQEFSYPLEKIYTLQVIDNSGLYLTGRNQKAPDYSGIMHWDGEQWFTLGEGIEGQVLTIKDYQGKLYMGGWFERAVGEPMTNFAIWEGE